MRIRRQYPLPFVRQCPTFRLHCGGWVVDCISLQRRLLLTPCLSPGISCSLLITIPGGRGCYRRVGRQGSRLLFPSLHLHGAILRRLWMNSVGSTRPFGPVLPGKSRGTSFSTIW